MGAARWASRPDPTIGYHRGAGPAQQKGSPMAVSTSAAGAWHPTVRFLLILVVAELFAYGALRAYTKHGG